MEGGNQTYDIMQIDAFQTEPLVVGPEYTWKNFSEQCAGALLGRGELVEQVISEKHLLGHVEWDERLGYRRSKDGPSRFGITVDIEFRNGRRIARRRYRSAADHKVTDHASDIGL